METTANFLSELEPRLDRHKLDVIVRHALLEDMGRGDITTQLTIPRDRQAVAEISAREDCVVCGLEVAEHVFKTVDKELKFTPLAREGGKVKGKKRIIRIEGLAQSILSAERVSLNLLGFLSGVATKTREYVERVKPYKVKITDTRKTFPGLRELQKYAVRIGGGFNHRMALDEMILIKDNHLKVTSGYTQLPKVPKGYKIEIEVQNLEEFRHALRFKPDIIMLDNMDVAEIKEAVKIRNGTTFNSHHPRTKLEASGGVELSQIQKIAQCGVDIISIGDLTHSVKSIDMGLDIL